MTFTRVDSEKLAAAAAVAEEHLLKARQALDPYLARLTEMERAGLLRPPVRFIEAGRDLVRVAGLDPEMARRCDFDPEAVTEDLDNVEAIAGLIRRVSELGRRLDDSRLLWLDEGYRPSLALYASSKTAAERDDSVQELVEPMAEVFASRRRPKGDEEKAYESQGI